MLSESAIIVSSRVCERICQNAILHFEDLIAKEWELRIQQEMIKKPFLWIFNKPALTREEAIKTIEKSYDSLGTWSLEPGFEYVFSLNTAKKIYEMCRHSNEVYLTQQDFAILRPFFPISQAMYR